MTRNHKRSTVPVNSPEPHRRARGSLTTHWQRVFISTLRKSPDVTQAARVARIHRSTCYRRREEDSTFAKAWDEAIAASLDRLEAVAFRRAEQGDSQILMWLLRCHRPERYSDLQRQEIGVTGGLVLLPIKQLGPQ